MAAQPVRKWYYLGGYFADRTTDPKYPLYIVPEAWQLYDPDVSFQLSNAYEALLMEDDLSNVKLLDLASFTEPPQPYEVWRGAELRVRNPAAPAHLRGKQTIAGFPADFWNEVENVPHMLPKSVSTWVDMGVGKIVAGFYQIHHESVGLLRELEASLGDITGRIRPPATVCRKRLAMCVEFPAGWHDVQKTSAPQAPPGSAAPIVDDDPPVYEWWYGDRPTEGELKGKQPMGFWKRYRPVVCKRLEEEWQCNDAFQQATAPVDADGTRYMIQRVTETCPFDYQGREGHGVTFPSSAVITQDYPTYEKLDRLAGNCLVQFRKGNPFWRRPARRRTNREEIARNAIETGEPCSVCFSEDGELTGCSAGHNICGDCLRSGLRAMVGDVTATEGLLCGCFDFKSRAPVMALAEKADVSLGALLVREPANKNEQMILDLELRDSRRQFDLGADGELPARLYVSKATHWFEIVHERETVPKYHVCVHPACAKKMENWILREDFDRDFRNNGQTTWTCGAGHKNTVLPTEAEIKDQNVNLLRHPEHFAEGSCGSDVPLRRHRLCRECIIGAGTLMLAEHGGACKHWPGSGRGHQHVFCFACTRTWGSVCSHGNRECCDPGIQQVRRVGDRLEIGYVDGFEYLQWLEGSRPTPPPTRFETEPATVDGRKRQEDYGMLDTAALLAESRQGTT